MMPPVGSPGMMPPGCCFGHLNGTAALLDLAVGYIVCYLASQVKENLLKKAGYIIGISIIVISGLVVIAKILSVTKCYIKPCPIMSSMNMQAPCANMPAQPRK